MNIAGGLIISKHGNVVLLGESFHQLFFVFEYPSHQIIGHADIQGPRPIGHDVDIVLIHAGLLQTDFRFLGRPDTIGTPSE